jgi:hypothetical protein
MEELLKLLNEFEKERKSWFTWRSIDSYDNCVYGVDCDWETEITMYSDLYSKYYGFIKHLVDNDKIDFRKLDPKINDSIPTRYYLWTYIRYSFEKEILMTLSIQDNPIEFLCSILK